MERTPAFAFLRWQNSDLSFYLRFKFH
jgi:hypothetical protein